MEAEAIEENDQVAGVTDDDCAPLRRPYRNQGLGSKLVHHILTTAAESLAQPLPPAAPSKPSASAQPAAAKGKKAAPQANANGKKEADTKKKDDEKEPPRPRVSSVYLHVHVANDEARRFWEKWGFEVKVRILVFLSRALSVESRPGRVVADWRRSLAPDPSFDAVLPSRSRSRRPASSPRAGDGQGLLPQDRAPGRLAPRAQDCTDLVAAVFVVRRVCGTGSGGDGIAEMGWEGVAWRRSHGLERRLLRCNDDTLRLPSQRLATLPGELLSLPRACASRFPFSPFASSPELSLVQLKRLPETHPLEFVTASSSRYLIHATRCPPHLRRSNFISFAYEQPQQRHGGACFSTRGFTDAS